MKKRLLIVISLILAVMSVLGACSKTPDDSTDETTGEPAVLLINNVDIKEYTLIFNAKRSADSDYFNDTLMESYGVELEKSKTAVEGYNIFIGVTGSDATVNDFYNAIDEGMIGYDGKNVYLLAKDNSMLYTVIDAFFAKYADGAITVTDNEKIAVAGDAIKVMSYNVLSNLYYDDAETLPRDITKLAEFIASEAPDVFGTQETQSFHKEEILKAMPDYDYYDGIPLNSNCTNTIFWNSNKFKLVEKGLRYLTNTPYIESKIPESNSIRGYSFVVLESLTTHNQFMFINTHLTYRNASGATDDDTPRYKQAQHLKKFLESEKYKELPIILVGDFNSVPTSNTIGLLGNVERFDRAESIADKKGDTSGTINSHSGKQHVSMVLDHIFVTSDRIATKYYTTLNEESKKSYTNPDGTVIERYLSDHMPVIAEIIIY